MKYYFGFFGTVCLAIACGISTMEPVTVTEIVREAVGTALFLILAVMQFCTMVVLFKLDDVSR